MENNNNLNKIHLIINLLDHDVRPNSKADEIPIAQSFFDHLNLGGLKPGRDILIPTVVEQLREPEVFPALHPLKRKFTFTSLVNPRSPGAQVSSIETFNHRKDFRFQTLCLIRISALTVLIQQMRRAML